MKKKDEPVQKRVPIPVAPAKDGETTDDRYFVDLQVDLDRLTASPDVLVSIPCWGWTGDGKTCSLLTAIHFCDVTRHGISLARVKDSAELQRLEERQANYRALGLAGIAEATVARLNQLNDVFLVDNAWPPGTETASQYLLEVRAKKGRVAFALLPDLRGGSFQQPDAAARTVSSGAHAFIVMVNPIRFVETSATGKEYRDDVIGRLQRCASDGLPTCIMIAKSDRNEPAADQTSKELAALLASLSFPAKIFRVSVVGHTPVNEGEPPPELGARKPDQLVRAWAWVMHAALTRPKDVLEANVPPTNLAEAARSRAPKTTAVRELRLVRDEQKSIGQVLCGIPNTSSPTFVLLDASGTLKEVTLDADGKAQLVERGKLVEGIEPNSVQAVMHEGSIFVSTSDTKIWVGPLTGPTSTELPYALVTWAPLSQQLIAGVDDKGTLHTLKLSAEKWTAVEYLPGFVKPSAHIAVGYLADDRTVLVSSLDVTSAVKVKNNGKFGERLTVAVSVPHAQGPVLINHQGYLVGLGAAHEVLFGREKAYNVGTALPESPLALAPGDAMLAWVGAENALMGSTFVDGKAVVTDAKSATKLSEIPFRMAWDSSGRLLMVTYANGRWSSFARHGF